jgi:uncharacterized protein (DUF302 family)
MLKNEMFGLAFVVLLTSLLVGASQADAQSNGLVTAQSKLSFDQTVAQLKLAVAKNGMMVLSELNQGKVLEMTGLKIKAVSLFVGNPTVGKKLFSAHRGVGIAVPVRVNVYEDTDGKTYVSYVKPSDQLTPFKNEQVTMIAKMLDEKLGMLTGMLAK